MTKLTVPLDSQVFVSTVESLERSQRPEYIFENLLKVMGGNGNELFKYAVEARIHWESRCCAMLEYSNPQELYQAAMMGLLPKVNAREKEVIHRLARSIRNEAQLDDLSLTDELAIEGCYRAEALLKHINNKLELLWVYLALPQALKKRTLTTEILSEINHKALALAQELGAKEEEMQVLNSFGRISELNHDLASSLQYYLKALDILNGIIKENNIDDSPRTMPKEYLMPKAALLFSIGNCKGFLGDIRDTITFCTQAAAYASRLEKDTLIVFIHLLLARSYSTLGAYHTSIEHIVHAGAIAEEVNSPHLIGKTKQFAASTFHKLGDFQKGIEFGLQAMSFCKIYESHSNYLLISARVGAMMVSAGEFERAQKFLNDILASIENEDKSINLNLQRIAVFRQLARIEVHYKNWEKALFYLEFPMQVIEDELTLPQTVADTLIIATDAHIGAKMYDSAAGFAERILNIGLTSNDMHQQYIAHQQLATIAELQGNITVAYHHYKEFHRIKEQIFNDESDQRNKNMQILLEEKEALRIAQAERLRRYELEEEIGQLSTALVHREQALKEIRSTLRSMKSTNEHAEQVVQVLQSVIRSSENTTTTGSTKTYKLIDEAIAANFPKLSRVQRELCRFVALGHSTKDIARLMGISVESVHTQRYRIRTRLSLGDSISLDLVIKQAVKQR